MRTKNVDFGLVGITESNPYGIFLQRAEYLHSSALLYFSIYKLIANNSCSSIFIIAEKLPSNILNASFILCYKIIIRIAWNELQVKLYPIIMTSD